MVIPLFVGKRDDIYTGTWVEFKPMSSQAVTWQSTRQRVRNVASSRQSGPTELPLGKKSSLRMGDGRLWRKNYKIEHRRVDAFDAGNVVQR